MREKVAFVVYQKKNDEILYFVGQRPNKIWLHPTAKLEESESYTAGAFREIKEELGEVIILNFTDLRKGYSFSNEFGKFNEHVVAFEIKEVDKLQEEEFVDYKFLPLNEALKILEHDNHKNNLKLVDDILKKHEETQFIIFVAPTACGKSVIIKSLLEKYPDSFERVKTYMTRPFKRAEDSLLRIHVTHQEFEKLDKSGLLIEKNFHDGNWYGSSFKLIEQALRSGKNLIAEIDINGLKELQKHFSNISSIFITAPLKEIEFRLRERGGHNDEEVIRRLDIAQREISRKDECSNIINNIQGMLDKTFKEVENIVLRIVKI